MPDQQLALSLLLELAVQRGSLNHILAAVRLLLTLWYSHYHDKDNRLSSSLAGAPLLPLLQRFSNMQPHRNAPSVDPMKGEEVRPASLLVVTGLVPNILL